MKTKVDVFDIALQRHLGKVPISQLDKKYDEWRSKGFSVLLDRQGDVCLDSEDDDCDDGKYYSEQLREIKKNFK